MVKDEINVVCFDLVEFPAVESQPDSLQFPIKYNNIRIYFHGPWSSYKRPFVIVSDYLNIKRTSKSSDDKLQSFLSGWRGQKVKAQAVYSKSVSELKDMLVGLNAHITYETKPGKLTLIRKIEPCSDPRVLKIKKGVQAPLSFYPKGHFTETHKEMDIELDDKATGMPDSYTLQTSEKAG